MPVIAKNPHVQAIGCHLRHLCPDVAHADDSKRLPGYVFSKALSDLHVSFLKFIVVINGSLRQHQNQTDRVLRHCSLIGACRIGHLNSPLRCCFHIDAVNPDAVHGNHLQLRALIHDFTGQMCVSCQDSVAILSLTNQCLRINSGSVYHFKTMFLQ